MSDNSSTFTLKINLRWLVWILLILNVLTLLLWSPWSSASVEGRRTIAADGQATIESTPDEFLFYPRYRIESTSREDLNSAIAERSESVLSGLKGIGVDDSQIEVQAGSYDYWYFDETESNLVATLSLTVTSADKDQSQQIQDYLLTTDVSGSITPQPQFSTERRAELRDQARSAAISDAKASAQRSAEELDFELGDVRTIVDSDDVSYPWYAYGGEVTTQEAAVDSASIPVSPGTKEFTYRVKVTYDIE